DRRDGPRLLDIVGKLLERGAGVSGDGHRAEKRAGAEADEEFGAVVEMDDDAVAAPYAAKLHAAGEAACAREEFPVGQALGRGVERLEDERGMIPPLAFLHLQQPAEIQPLEGMKAIRER